MTQPDAILNIPGVGELHGYEIGATTPNAPRAQAPATPDADGAGQVHPQGFELYCPTSRQLFAYLDTGPTERSGHWPALFAAEIDSFKGSGIQTPQNTVKRALKLAHWTPKTYQATLYNAPDLTPVASDPELSRLREIQEAIDGHNGEMSKLSPVVAESFARSQTAELAKRAVGGKLPSEVIVRSREEIHIDYRKRRNAISLMIAPLTEESTKLSVTVIQRALARVREWMMTREDLERREAAEYDIVFMPSYLLKCGASILLQASTDPALIRQRVTPRGMLAGIVQL